jgi:CheY-like chemotaxis protein
MDVQIPIMDGWEADWRIRGRERGTASHIPIIAMTEHAMSGDRETCFKAGMDGYVAKPVDPDQLFARQSKVRPALERSRTLSPKVGDKARRTARLPAHDRSCCPASETAPRTCLQVVAFSQTPLNLPTNSVGYSDSTR